MENLQTDFKTDKVEEILGYQFKNKNLLKVALTHSSYAHKYGLENNERLEFFGDSVLGFIVSEFLFENFVENEGVLSKMRASVVSCKFLSEIITKLGLNEFLKASPDDLKNGEKARGSLFEALLGAMYLDSNMQICKEFVGKVLDLTKENVKNVFEQNKDFKTLLQEKVQANKGTIEYKLLSVSGEENAKIFEMELEINGKTISSAKSSSKQKAENLCAKYALENYYSV